MRSRRWDAKCSRYGPCDPMPHNAHGQPLREGDPVGVLVASTLDRWPGCCRG